MRSISADPRNRARTLRAVWPRRVLASLVGVIVSLALFFAHHVLWPRGFNAPVDWVSLLIGASATIALFRFKVGVIPVILACGLAGLGITLLR